MNSKIIKLLNGRQAFKHLEYMEALGPRVPDSTAHKKLEQYIINIGKKTKARFYQQQFQLTLRGQKTNFNNLIFIFEGKNINKRLLLGTHYDSRIIADNESDEFKRNQPIPGINDGGSGTAVFLELLSIFERFQPEFSIALAFFDAEDIGNMDGYEFCEGSKYFASHFTEFVPDEVIILDMIGGEEACFNVDYEALENPDSRALLQRLWNIGNDLDLKPFTSNQEGRGSWFICDHTPFVRKNIPSVILIDIDYAWWHTLDDTCRHCSADSLEAAAKVLLAYIYEDQSVIDYT